MSRQREWAKRQRERGRCTQCGSPASPSKRKGVEFRRFCDPCAKKALERQRERQGYVRRNLGAQIYQEEK